MTVLIQFLINTCIKIDLFSRECFAGCRAGRHAEAWAAQQRARSVITITNSSQVSNQKKFATRKKVKNQKKLAVFRLGHVKNLSAEKARSFSESSLTEQD